jgi:predicted dehydrogenase
MHPIRIGMVGLGIMGRRYYRMLQELEGVEVTALCVRHLDTIQDLPGAKFADYRLLCASGQVVRCSLPHRTIAILRSPSKRCTVVCTS